MKNYVGILQCPLNILELAPPLIGNRYKKETPHKTDLKEKRCAPIIRIVPSNLENIYTPM